MARYLKLCIFGYGNYTPFVECQQDIFEAKITLLHNTLKNGLQVVGGSNPLAPTSFIYSVPAYNDLFFSASARCRQAFKYPVANAW